MIENMYVICIDNYMFFLQDLQQGQKKYIKNFLLKGKFINKWGLYPPTHTSIINDIYLLYI